MTTDDIVYGTKPLVDFLIHTWRNYGKGGEFKCEQIPHADFIDLLHSDGFSECGRGVESVRQDSWCEK